MKKKKKIEREWKEIYVYVHFFTWKNMYLTSSLVVLSCRWPGDEVRRSGNTELGRDPGDESDLWKSPPLPPPLERSPLSRFYKNMD